MFKELLAALASAISAIAVVVVAVVILWPLSANTGNRLWEVALHFGIFGSVIIFPLVFLIAMPLYYVVRVLGLLSWPAIMFGGVLIALVYPFITLIENKPGFVAWWHFLICGIAGAIAALVFCRVAGIKRARS